jgi:NADPH-dependent 2,4-dienoyl-CoA reductase/sulfur reductase-like enzyme
VVNPRVGREAMYPDVPASKPKRVLVAGGGPGGMMAALTAAARGHHVTLCERGTRLGGQLLMGDVPPHKEAIRELREYLTRQIAKSGVEIRFETTVTRELIERDGAEAVIVATGARPLAPSVLAVDAKILSSWDVLSGRETVGAKVVVMGGGEVGCELAELLAVEGRVVVIVEMLPEILNGTEPRARVLLLRRLRDLGVQVLTQSRVVEVRGAVVTYACVGLKSRITGVDTVVAALGSKADTTLAAALGHGENVHVIGDCVKPRRILEAIRDGFEVAYGL